LRKGPLKEMKGDKLNGEGIMYQMYRIFIMMRVDDCNISLR